MQCRWLAIVLAVLGVGPAYGMRTLLNYSKKCSMFRSVILVKAGDISQNSDVVPFGHPEYRKLGNSLTKCLKRENAYGVDSVFNTAIASERHVEDSTPKVLALYLSRLKPEKFVALVTLSKENNLWKKRYAWDGNVLDTFFNNLDLFDTDKRYEIFGLLVRYKAHYYSFYNWCCKNLDQAYEYIGYDGLKKLYESALEYEKHCLEDAYRLNQKTMYANGRRLYWLDEIFEYRDRSEYL